MTTSKAKRFLTIKQSDLEFVEEKQNMRSHEIAMSVLAPVLRLGS